MTGPEEYPARPHLTNSRPLRWSCAARTDAEAEAIDHLTALLEDGEQRARKRRGDDRARLRATMEAIVLDLYRSAKADPETFLAYSRRKEDYGRAGDHPLASLTTVTTVVAFLAASGYATVRLGSYSRRQNPFGPGQVGRGYLSRIRAETPLVELLEGVFGVSPAGVAATQRPPQEVLVVRAPAAARGARKRPLRIAETAETRAMAERVAAANALRAECLFTFDGPVPAGVDLAAIYQRRIFNNARLDHGGRFYGGWWERLAKADRARILIDGEEAVELDYRAHHPRLCFHLAGQPVPPGVDPYDLPGWDAAIYRDAAKRTFGRLLNSEPSPSASRPKRPTGTAKLFRSAQEYAAFSEAVEQAFRPVQDWLRAGRGLELQFIDSRIADAVIAELTEQSIPCLPVHDSFIVPRSYERAVGVAMLRSYEAVLAGLTSVRTRPLIAGWTTLEMEQEVLTLADLESVSDHPQGTLGHTGPRKDQPSTSVGSSSVIRLLTAE